jgi:hypothetical protein
VVARADARSAGISQLSAYDPPLPSDPIAELSNWYCWFAAHEAAGRSALYVEFADGVARDRELLAVLCELPEAKRQPNLLFAALRHVCGLPGGWPEFRDRFFEHQAEITNVIMTRRTQTNEPARCATLLPALARLPQPLALIEVGAAAGLCLLPDRYGFDYRRLTVMPADRWLPAPVFACDASEGTPLPESPVEVVWRTGLDLNPLDVTDPEDMAWLEALVWPGEGRRLELLRGAIEVARRDPPPVVRGDLRNDLRSVAAQAPPDATLVIFHTAVLAYVLQVEARDAFGETVRSLGARWLANEGADILRPRQHPGEQPWPTGDFVLTLDRVPLARTDPHGTWIEWSPRGQAGQLRVCRGAEQPPAPETRHLLCRQSSTLGETAASSARTGSGASAHVAMRASERRTLWSTKAGARLKSRLQRDAVRSAAERPCRPARSPERCVCEDEVTTVGVRDWRLLS